MLDSKNNYKAWLYLLPILILMGIFTFYPLINSFLLIFQDWGYVTINGKQTIEFFGVTLNNFTSVLTDPTFGRAILNTLLIVVISVPCSVILSLLIAVGLNSIKKFQKVFQTIFFLPYVTNTIAIGMVFSVLFTTSTYNTGLINYVVGLIGISPIDWIGPTSSYISKMFVLQLYIVWSALPFKILLFLSALQSVDKQYYQAAQIDHASKATTLRRITIPLISPIIAYVTITSFIGSFKEYSSIIGLFGADAGPATQDGSMGTIVWYIYQHIGNKSYAKSETLAATASVILLAIILCVTAVNFYISKKKVHY